MKIGGKGIFKGLMHHILLRIGFLAVTLLLVVSAFFAYELSAVFSKHLEVSSNERSQLVSHSINHAFDQLSAAGRRLVTLVQATPDQPGQLKDGSGRWLFEDDRFSVQFYGIADLSSASWGFPRKHVLPSKEQFEQAALRSQAGLKWIKCDRVCFLNLLLPLPHNADSFVKLSLSLDGALSVFDQVRTADLAVFLESDCRTGHCNAHAFATDKEAIASFVENKNINVNQQHGVSDDGSQWHFFPLVSRADAAFSDKLIVFTLEPSTGVYQRFKKSVFQSLLILGLGAVLVVFAVAKILRYPVHYFEMLSKVFPRLGKKTPAQVQAEMGRVYVRGEIAELDQIQDSTTALSENLFALHEYRLSQTRHLSKALSEKKKQYDFLEEVVNTGSIYFAVCDENLNLLNCNNRLDSLLHSIGRSSDGQLPFFDHPADTDNDQSFDKLESMIKQARKGEESRLSLTTHYEVAEVSVDILWHVSCSVDPVKEQVNVICTGIDVTHSLLMEKLAYTDMLTGLKNRRGFEKTVRKWIGSEKPFSIFNLDLNDFKLTNDRFGHSIGDQVLKEIAKIISKQTPQGTLSARIGGDQFLLAIPRDEKSHDEDLARALLQALTTGPMKVHGVTLPPLKAALGIARFPENALSWSSLLSRADAAMYESKRYGRNDYHVYTGFERNIKSLRSAQIWSERLDKFMCSKTIVPHFQSVLDCESMQPLYHEALCRINDSAGKVLYNPKAFFPYIQNTDSMMSLDAYMLDQTLAALKSSAVSGCVGVNLSTLSLASSEFFDVLVETMERYNIKGSQLVIEITEHAPIEQRQSTLSFMNQAIDLGVRFALDDFGKGFSGYSSLEGLPLSFVKLDRSMLKRGLAETRSRYFMSRFISLAQSIGLLTIVEGVENSVEFEMVKELGADYCQGFWLGRPSRHVDENLSKVSGVGVKSKVFPMG